MSECSCPPWVNSVEETCDDCKVEINEYHRTVGENERAEERFAEVNAELSRMAANDSELRVDLNAVDVALTYDVWYKEHVAKYGGVLLYISTVADTVLKNQKRKN